MWLLHQHYFRKIISKHFATGSWHWWLQPFSVLCFFALLIFLMQIQSVLVINILSFFSWLFLHNRSGWIPSNQVDFLHAVKSTFDVLLGRHPNEPCGDMIFSGHTRYTISSLSVLSTYLSKYPLKYSLPCYLIGLILALFALYSFVRVFFFHVVVE